MALASIPLNVELSAKIAGFQRDMQAGVGIAQTSAKSIAAAFAGASTAVTALVGGAFVASISAMVTSSATAVDSFNDLHDATGASIENISALDRIARETGGSFDTVATSLVKFNGVLTKTGEDGNAAAVVFKALGLNADELKKMDPAEAMLKAAVALNSFADNGDKARAVQVLFGKSIQEVAPFLKDLAEKGQLVATTTTAQAEEAEKYNKQLFRMKANHEDLVRNIASSVLPTLNDLLEKLQAAGGFSGSIKIRLGLDDQSKTESQLFTLRKAADFTFASIERMSAELSKSPQDGAVAQRLDAARTRYADLSKQIGETSNKLKAAANVASPLPGATVQNDAARPSLVVPPTPKVPQAEHIDRQAKAYTELINKIKEKIAIDELETATGVKLTGAQKQQLDITRLVADGKIKASDANSAVTKTLLAELAASEAVNAQKKVQLDFDQALRDSAYATATARSKEVDALTQSNQKFAEEIELIGKNEEAQRAIIHARESSTIAIKAEQLARMDLIGVCSIESEALRTEIELLKERQSLGDTKSARIIDEADTKAQKQYTDDLKKDLASAFSDALKSTKNPIEAFGISLAKTVASRLSASLAESLASASLGALGLGGSSTVSGGGMAGGILGSLVTSIASAWAGGAVSGSVSAPSAPSAGANYSLASSASSSSLSGIKLAGYRAEGGDVEAGKMYRVNERGPEVLNVGNAQYLMMGGKNGHVSKNIGAQGQGGGRTVHVNTTINLGPGSNADDFRRSKSQIEASLARTVRGAMA